MDIVILNVTTKTPKIAIGLFRLLDKVAAHENASGNLSPIEMT